MDKKTERIKYLADRYLEGQTDAEQEKELAEMLGSLRQDNLPDGLSAVAAMFRGFKAVREEKIQGPWDVAHSTIQARREKKRHSRLKRIITAVALPAVAAAAAAVILSGRTIYGYDSEGRPITDPEKALAHAECLQMLSGLEESLRIADGVAGMLGHTAQDRATEAGSQEYGRQK